MSDDLLERLRTNDLDECYDAADRIEALEAENELLKLSRPQWQPIETAPRDGTWILLWRKPEDFHENWSGGYIAAHWHTDGWMLDVGDAGSCAYIWTTTPQPTHWMPLPEPPVKMPDAAAIRTMIQEGGDD